MPATPVQTQNWLGWAWQSGFVNRVKRPSSFLKTLIFGGRSENLPTESVELSFREGERLLAPFVEVNSEAIPVGSRSTTFATVSTPNIRIKRPMEAYNVFNRRLPGSGVFISGGGQVARARRAAIAEDLEYMVDLIENREEWMVAQLIDSMDNGFLNLEYKVEDRASWRLRIPRSTDMDVTLTNSWNGGGTGADIQGDTMFVKRLFSKHINAPLSTCVMGSTASDYFQKNTTVQNLLDKRNISAGALSLISQFNESGAIYLGRVFGVDFWEYSREYTDGGSSAPFIDPTHAIWIAGGRALADSKILYGAIPDHGAFEAGNFVGKRFSKSWKEEDPSVYVQLMQTRPLPYIRQPNAFVVMDVIT